jgi:serine/threonine-protein kinase
MAPDDDPAYHGSDEETATIAERPSASHPSSPQIGSDRYALGERIGRGGMGEVLVAQDRQIGREVAIKRMRAKEPPTKSILRFEREARIQGRLDHPAIPPVHELARDAAGLPFFAMKKLAGTTLAEILTKGESTKFPRQRLLRAFADVCLAIEFAHTRGFVHRDLKPENIMLGDFGEVYVLDWGVAKVTGEEDDGFIGVDSGELVTRDGIAIGTPGYMSPEQARGDKDVDGRADVYGLGCLLFEILAGERLHKKGGAWLIAALEGIDGHPANRAPGRDIAPELDELCAAALATEREDRIQTARELGERVQQFLDGDRDLALRRRLANDHLAAAFQAFRMTDDAEARRTAMREAGRALALDPTLTGAAELITRLMLEPPQTIPKEVAQAIDSDNEKIVQRTAVYGMWTNLSYLVFAPLLLWVGMVQPAYVIVMFGLAITNAALMRYYAAHGDRFKPLLVGTTSVLLVASVALTFSPFLVAPGIAAVTAMGLVFGPAGVMRRRAVVIIFAMSLAVLAPWLGELIGSIPSTMTIDGAVTMRSPALSLTPVPTLVLLVSYTVMLITAAVMRATGLRRAERSARRSLHLQAWHLRQLVPEA